MSLREFFAKKKHFHVITYATKTGFQSIVMQSDSKAITPNRLVLFAIDNGLPADAPIISVSHLGKMSLFRAKHE